MATAPAVAPAPVSLDRYQVKLLVFLSVARAEQRTVTGHARPAGLGCRKAGERRNGQEGKS